MYAQVYTHPNIAYIIGMLCKYMSNPGMDHWVAAIRVMQYLQRTKDFMLTYKKSNQFEIIGAKIVGDPSGYVFLLVGRAISWRSVKRTLVASFTIATKYIACYEASNHEICLRNFVTGLPIMDGIERPLKIFCDNKSTGMFSNNNRSLSK